MCVVPLWNKNHQELHMYIGVKVIVPLGAWTFNDCVAFLCQLRQTPPHPTPILYTSARMVRMQLKGCELAPTTQKVRSFVICADSDAWLVQLCETNVTEIEHVQGEVWFALCQAF